MTLFHEEYTIDILVELAVKENIGKVQEMAKDVLPCNLVAHITLHYNEHSKLEPFTHGQLSAHTHDYLREEVLTNGNEYNEL